MIGRRQFIVGGATGLLLPSMLRAQAISPTQNLPSPTFAGTPEVWKGLRPYRRSGLRLEVVEISSRLLVHNYGHGGSGITLSWGCADWVATQLSQRSGTLPGRRVAVLGSGVNGLTTATRLKRDGYDVTVYTEKLWAETTSAVAGGQFAPSLVKMPVAGPNIPTLEGLTRAAYREHLLRGVPFGVVERDNYTHARGEDLDVVADSCGTERARYARLPFAHMIARGWKYRTLLINPRTFLPKLESDLRSAGVAFRIGRLNRAGVDGLTENIVVNCLGLGSGSIWPDTDLFAKKGILAVLPREPGLEYLYSSIGYVFPRSDHLIVGGTIEDLPPGTTDINATTTPNISDLQKAQFILRIARRVFQGDLPVPEWLSGGDRISGGMFIDSNLDLNDATVPKPPPDQ